MLKIAVAICTYNRYDLLPKAIESVLNQSLPNSEYEILIIDNTPDAHLNQGQEFAKRYADIENLKYVFEPIAGLSNARNVAMRMTDALYISYLDDDAIASPEWLENVIKGFESFEQVGVVGGQIKPMFEIAKPTWLGDNLLGHVSVVDWGGELRVADEDEWFAGANISFERNILVKSGGFSTSLGRIGNGNSLMSNEEIQVLEFIKSEGLNAVYSPAASVDHLVEKKRLERTWFRRRVAWQATSDFVMNPEKTEDNLTWKLKNVKQFIASLPPLQRNLQGLYVEVNDSDLFTWQLSALYDFTVLTLAGFSGLENE